MNNERSVTIKHTYKTNVLKTLRIRAGLSQIQLSERSGVPLKCIGNYEQGRRDLNHARGDILYHFAKTLDCTIEDLLTLS